MISIIIGTHGRTSEELLRSGEMIYGKQENIATITFKFGENVEDLIRKYNAALDKLDCTNGVLFMVDLFGGSPFNAASTIAAKNQDMDVVTGVNIPMLLEVFSARDRANITQIVEISKNAGHQGIKSLKESLKNVKEEEL